MTVCDPPTHSVDPAFQGMECPAPISLETMAVVEQVLAQLLAELRQKLAGSVAPAAGAAEYASWFRAG